MVGSNLFDFFIVRIFEDLLNLPDPEGTPRYIVLFVQWVYHCHRVWQGLAHPAEPARAYHDLCGVEEVAIVVK